MGLGLTQRLAHYPDVRGLLMEESYQGLGPNHHDLTHALRGTVKGRKRFFSRPIGKMVEKWCPSAFQGVEIERFIVRRAILPTPKENANPFERQCPGRSLV
jgi:hypothetical protein